MIAVRTTVTFTGDTDMFERVSDRLQRTRELMLKIGVLGGSSAVRRLRDQQTGSEVATGRLMGSVTFGPGGQSDGDGIFELSQGKVTIGSNLVYAAQRQFGGTITPKRGKALAIPLDPRIARLGIGPGEADPERKIFDFVPVRGGVSGHVIGLLVDTEGLFGRPGDALYALATSVTQPPRPYLFWSDDDVAVIKRDLIPQHLGLEL